MLYTRTFAAKDVGAARALLLRAVWSTVARITLASHRLLAVPRQLVRSPLCLCQCLLIKTNSAARAIVRAGSALTRLAVIILKAVAFSSGLIAYSLVRTLYPWVCWCCLLWGGGGAERMCACANKEAVRFGQSHSPKFSPSTSVLVGAHAVPLGHVRREQSAPVQARTQTEE